MSLRADVACTGLQLLGNAVVLLDAAVHLLRGIDGDSSLLPRLSHGFYMVDMVMRDEYGTDGFEA